MDADFARKSKEFQPLSTYIKPRLEPIMHKKSGFDMALLDSWPQIVGEELAQICTPFKLSRARRPAAEKAPSATLSIACEGLASLKIQHQLDDILEKINLFFGCQAIGKIKIVQKSLSHFPDTAAPRRILSKEERAWLKAQTCSLEDDVLRAAMIRLGENIMATSLCPKKSNI